MFLSVDKSTTTKRGRFSEDPFLLSHFLYSMTKVETDVRKPTIKVGKLN